MAIYTCGKCGMSVGTMTCGHCGKELVHDTLALDNGNKVDIAKCPDGHGKVPVLRCRHELPGRLRPSPGWLTRSTVLP